MALLIVRFVDCLPTPQCLIDICGSQSAVVLSGPRLARSVISQRPKTAQQPPAEKASSIIDSLPGNSVVSKTGFVVLSTGALATAISQELYVVTEETIVLAGFIGIFTVIAKSIKEPYTEWAAEKINVGLLSEKTSLWRVANSYCDVYSTSRVSSMLPARSTPKLWPTALRPSSK